MTDLIEIVNKNKLRYSDWGERAEETKKKFLEEFGIEKLKEYVNELNSRERLIYCGKANQSYLIEKITTNSAIESYFGSANMTVTATLMLNYNKDTKSFRYGISKKSEIDADTAEKKSKKILNAIVELVEFVGQAKLITLDDYRKLEKEIAKKATSMGVDKDFITSYHTIKIWFLKYINICFEDKFCSFYSPNWTMFMCKKLNLYEVKEESSFIRNCAISMKMNELANQANTNKVVVYRALLNEFGTEFEEENRGIQSFVFPANADLYDHEKAFEKNKVVDWSCKAQNINVDDIVYLYVSKTREHSRIKYKCRVLKTGIANNEAIDDIEFYTDPKKRKKGKRVRLELVQKSDAEELIYRNLQDKVEFEAPQSFRRLKKNEVDYIDSFFNTDSSASAEATDTKALDNKEEAIELTAKIDLPDQKISDKLKPYVGKNVIFYGVPGCGKSRFIKELLDGIDKCYYKRILFHPEYSYGDFIGQIIPTLDKDNKPTYEFKEGPMLQMLKLANDNENKEFFLIIEEINRGNAPAIFGDFFQLLDRNGGKSEYSINNAEIEKKLNKKEIEIPKNLTILATMNTCDQNVFTLDTAFKRRFRMTRIKNSFDKVELVIKGEGFEIEWKKLGPAINTAIVEKCNDGVSSEDKQLGAYFVHGEEIDIREFAEKVLMYLWDDVVKYDKQQLFKSTYKTLDSLIDAFCEGKNVFADSCADIKSIYDKIEEEKAKKAEEVSEIKPEEEKETPEE